MHPYSIQSARWRKVGYLMLATVGLAGPVNAGLRWLTGVLRVFEYGVIPPAVPILLLFSGLYVAWERYLWRAPLIHRLTGPPDLNGEWVGQLQSSHFQQDLEAYMSDGGQQATPPRMVIDQTWTRISVTIYFPTSTSVSTTASFLQDMADPVLRITYRNTPSGDSVESMTMHTGTNDLRYRNNEEGEFLEGKYYTDEHRNNHGTIQMKKAE